MGLPRTEIYRRYRAKNREKVNERNRKYRSDHPEKVAQWNANHRAKSAEYSKRYRERHPEATKAAQDRWRKNHPRQVANNQRAVKARRKAQGVCSQCGQLPLIDGRQYCLECKTKQIRTITNTREDRISHGLCAVCGCNTAMPDPTGRKWYCTTCYLKNVANIQLGSAQHWTTLREKLEQQGGRCPYTGERLVLGVNASVDHVLPVSRFPERRTDPRNVEWVTRRINSMKGNMTEQEFLNLLSSILRHRENTHSNDPHG